MEQERTDSLREAFVEMLFALAVAQVAVNAASVVATQMPVTEKLPAFSHLLLALVLIACSWVGWRQSRSPGMKERITSVFGGAFLGLLLDVMLVVLYFMVVQTAESAKEAPMPTKPDAAVLSPASAVPEARLLSIIFAFYAFWDLIADVFSRNCIPGGPMGFRVW